ncbi:MAG: hypothetical protein QGH58_00590 [Arenicellales bacterium]|nr:hypothetical protein [Arenicellales bacterium]
MPILVSTITRPQNKHKASATMAGFSDASVLKELVSTNHYQVTELYD